MEKYDYLFKVVLIGDSGVGKTNLLLRISQNTFFNDTKPTIGVEFDAKTFVFGDHKVKAQIWDTAGQERYRAITSAYYRGTLGAFLVFDLGCSKSFENCLQYWLLQLKEHGDPRMVVALVGNKSDLPNEVDIEKAKVIAQQNKMLFFETSAKTGVNVVAAFTELMKAIYDKCKNEDVKASGKKSLKGRTIKQLKKTKKRGCC